MVAYLVASLVLAALLAAASYVRATEYRAASVRLGAPVGVLLGVALAIGGATTAWRTLGAERDVIVLAGIAVAMGWMLVLTLDRIEGHAATAASFGVAACALPLYAAGRWLIPCLMFLGAVAVGGALTAVFGRSGSLLLQVAVGASAISGAWLLERGDSWARPQGFEGIEAALLAAGVVVLAWPLARTGAWRVAGTPASAAIPILGATAFATLAAADLAPQPWAASGVLAVAIAVTTWELVRSQDRFAPGPLAVGVALAAALVSPDLAVPAGISAVLAGGIGALGAPYGLGAGFVGGVAPLTAGWLVLLAAVIRAFRFAGGSADIIDRLPWLTFTSLAPLVLMAGLLAAGSWICRAVSSGRLRAAAGESALAYSVISVAFPVTLLRLEGSPLGDGGGVTWLLVTAAVAGIGAGAFVQSRVSATEEACEASFSLTPEPGRIDRIAGLAGGVVLVGLVVMTAFLTVEGLKVGFLGD